MNRRYCPAWVVVCLLFLTLKSTAVERNIQPSVRPTGPSDLLLHFAERIHHTNLDCSHFVHAVYERAGLHYDYATSRKLYRGWQEFRRVSAPQPGDLIVWRGHVGIVVRPEQHTFLSALAKGVSLSSYTSQYWAKRGDIRFFRYVEKDTPG
jgi:cell wall-associated NlpC family hydrolase